jgi:hypothetical protein
MWTKLVTFFAKNWKTTVGGLLVGITAILLQSGVITVEISSVVTTVLIALGFIAAKDGDKTGV